MFLFATSVIQMKSDACLGLVNWRNRLHYRIPCVRGLVSVDVSYESRCLVARESGIRDRRCWMDLYFAFRYCSVVMFCHVLGSILDILLPGVVGISVGISLRRVFYWNRFHVTCGMLRRLNDEEPIFW